MATEVHYTTSANPSPEYVRRSTSGGLELVKTSNGIETAEPVRITAKIEGRRIIVGLEAAPIIWTVKGQRQDMTQVLI